MIGYEPSDMPARGAAAVIAGLFALLLLAGGTVALLLRFISTGEPRPAHTVVAKPPPPRLEVTPIADRLQIEATAKRRLREGPTRASIEQAMTQVAQAGWRDGGKGEAK